MKRLPADAKLLVEPAKIKDYLFNRNHPVGQTKADYFLGKGFSDKHPKIFIEALKEHARTRPVANKSVCSQETKIGIECNLNFPDGKERCIRTVWIHQKDGQYRLVTAYPHKKQKGK